MCHRIKYLGHFRVTCLKHVFSLYFTILSISTESSASTLLLNFDMSVCLTGHYRSIRLTGHILQLCCHVHFYILTFFFRHIITENRPTPTNPTEIRHTLTNPMWIRPIPPTNPMGISPTPTNHQAMMMLMVLNIKTIVFQWISLTAWPFSIG